MLEVDVIVESIPAVLPSKDSARPPVADKMHIPLISPIGRDRNSTIGATWPVSNRAQGEKKEDQKCTNSSQNSHVLLNKNDLPGGSENTIVRS